MTYRLSDDQRLLSESVRAFFTGTHPPQSVRQAASEGHVAATVRQGLVEMGLTRLLVPEAHGGLGLGFLEGALVAREAGRVCLADPLLEAALVAAPWLASRGQTDALDAISEGRSQAPLAHEANPWVLGGGGDRLDSIDPLRRLTTAPQVRSDDALLLNIGALMTAAELVGLAEAMLEQACAYAKVRQQFGQPIGAFQAIKHQLANCAVCLEFARPVVWRAACALQDGTPTAPLHVSHAKVVATDAAWSTAETAIQVHGAMGYTYEVDLHFWMKRSWALAGAWGHRDFHLNRIDAALIGGDVPVGPSFTFI